MTNYKCDSDGCMSIRTYVLVSRRPSDHSELVSTLALCEEHINGSDVSDTVEKLSAHLKESGVAFATQETVFEYGESDLFAADGLVWLSV